MRIEFKKDPFDGNGVKEANEWMIAVKLVGIMLRESREGWWWPLLDGQHGKWVASRNMCDVVDWSG